MKILKLLEPHSYIGILTNSSSETFLGFHPDITEAEYQFKFITNLELEDQDFVRYASIIDLMQYTFQELDTVEAIQDCLNSIDQNLLKIFTKHLKNEELTINEALELRKPRVWIVVDEVSDCSPEDTHTAASYFGGVCVS